MLSCYDGWCLLFCRCCIRLFSLMTPGSADLDSPQTLWFGARLLRTLLLKKPDVGSVGDALIV